MAYEVFCSREGMACAPWPSLFHSSKELWAAVESAIRAENAAKVRAEAIEECAKVAEAFDLSIMSMTRMDVQAREISAAIRALGEKAANPSRPE
jgi:hypothetical protein